MFLFVFWLRKRPSIKYVRNQGNGGGIIQNVYKCLHGERCITLHVYVRTYTRDSFFMFLSYGVFFICRNLTLPTLKKVMFVRSGCFFPMRSISVAMKQVFFILNCFCEPRLAKTVLILIKQNLRYTLNFSVTFYFKKILCSVARRFI